MATGLNKVSLIGNLGQDPELRQTNGGTAVCTLRLATNERRKNGDNWEDHVEWHSVVCFGRTAENVEKFCSKGKQLYIEGRIQTRKWQDKEGNDRYSTEIVANNILFLSGEGGGQKRISGGDAGSEPFDSGADAGDAPFPDDVPF